MAGFPPNLDDGELWLPSDIFPDEVSSKIRPKFSPELTYMEDIAQQISAYALLERNQIVAKPPLNLVPNLEIKRQSRYGTVTAPQTRFGFGFRGVHGVGHNDYVSVNEDRFRVGLGQIYQYRSMSPVQSQVENYLQARARVSQRLQNHNQGQNHFLPFQVTGSSIGGFVRESGGTGVFLPRVATTVDVKKKHGVKKGEETKQRQPNKNNDVEKQERLQLSPEVRLPQDWTY
ncbi:uncharacterized protein LOC122640230 isoform X2 [Telopea speciosissima]|uniref:uncharacterized protein LOC122640230 isoform X2 n=1 Tax=Telopea speciosissima TaxID=54955 RepID=UPI001CC729E2|nr:uncharacterized protein LOC122640230 isoform X2 [Telopea speciosissima]